MDVGEFMNLKIYKQNVTKHPRTEIQTKRFSISTSNHKKSCLILQQVHECWQKWNERGIENLIYLQDSTGKTKISVFLTLSNLKAWG